MVRQGRKKLERRLREAEDGWMDKKAVYCHNERAENRDGRMDGCVELLFTSVNSRVIALIADVNNSKPLDGNSLWEEPTHAHTRLTPRLLLLTI